MKIDCILHDMQPNAYGRRQRWQIWRRNKRIEYALLISFWNTLTIISHRNFTATLSVYLHSFYTQGYLALIGRIFKCVRQ